MSLKEKLKAKITSKEAYDAILLEANKNNSSMIGKPKGEGRSDDYVYVRANDLYDSDNRQLRYKKSDTADLVPQFRVLSAGQQISHALHWTRWWLAREHARVAAGLYHIPGALERAYLSFPELCPHVRLDSDDRLAVYFTPDHVAGERDQQVKTSLGRLLRRLYPQVSDAVIRDVEAEFRGELTGELEILPPEQISAAYQATSATSCMTYKAAHFRTLSPLYGAEYVHPTEVYNAPGFGLAVMRRDDAITARSLVWVNPDDPSDKRFVRVYGDPALTRRLKVNGFRHAGLAGARIRRIPVSEFGGKDYTREDYVLMPYIDNTSQELQAYGCVRDGEMLRVLDSVTVERLRSVGVYVGGVSGSITQLPTTSTIDALYATCPVTKERFEVQKNSPEILLSATETAKLSPAGARTIANQPDKWKRIGAYTNVGWTLVWASVDVPTFEHRGVFPLQGDAPLRDSEREREVLGYQKLDEELYPDVGWIRGERVSWAYRSLEPTAEARSLIRTRDAVDVVSIIDGQVAVRATHVSFVAGKKLAKVHRLHRDKPTLVMPGVKIERTATSNRQVVPDVHPLVRLFDGRYEFYHNAVERRVLGVPLWELRGAPANEKDRFEYAMAEVLRTADTLLDVQLPLTLDEGSWYRDTFDAELEFRGSRYLSNMGAALSSSVYVFHDGDRFPDWISTSMYSLRTNWERIMGMCEVASWSVSDPERYARWMESIPQAHRPGPTTMTVQNALLLKMSARMDELRQLRTEACSTAPSAVEAIEDELLAA